MWLLRKKSISCCLFPVAYLAQWQFCSSSSVHAWCTQAAAAHWCLIAPAPPLSVSLSGERMLSVSECSHLPQAAALALTDAAADTATENLY